MKRQGRELFFWFVIAANIIGAVWGFVFYYGDRLASTPLPLALFVPDCPLYVSFFVISALLIVSGKTKSWFSKLFIFVTSAGLMKYTLWTMFVILFFNSYFLSPAVLGEYILLFILHFLALLEVFAFVGKVDLKWISVAVAVVWLVLNDAVDYILGTHPTLPMIDMGQFTVLIMFTVMLSLLCPVIYYSALGSKLKFFTRILFD
jgi:uncharacterized membrane protein YpjA